MAQTSKARTLTDDREPESAPSQEHEIVCTRCGRSLDAAGLAAGRCGHCKCFVQVAGGSKAAAQASFKHGRFAATPPPLLPAEDPAASNLSLPSTSTELRANLEQDQGGDASTAKKLLVQRVVETEALLRTIAQSLVQDGVLTTRGRPRSALTAYLAVLSQQERVLARLGLERRPKDAGVLELSAADYIAQAQSHEDKH